MDGDYEVEFRNRSVGRVNVRRQGLYYRFSCRCRLEGNELYCLKLRCDNTMEKLGILVPIGDCFGLDTRIPVKRFGEGKPEFRLATKRDTEIGTVVNIYPEEPFAYIARLKNAYLVKQNGELCIGFQ